LNQFGREFSHGTCPYVGIGGHSLLGGFAYASRLWGLVLDVIELIDLVLANGTITTASKDHNPELFWVTQSYSFSFSVWDVN
jgi:FAD/FMN-containing dehydrogenase